MERETEKVEDIDAYLETWNEENSFSEEDEENAVGENENEKNSVEEADEGEAEENTSINEDRAEEAENENDAETDPEASNEGTALEDPGEEKQKNDTPSEKESSKNGNQLLEEKLAAELPAIQKEYPDVKSAADIGNLSAYVVLTGMCKMSPTAAYRALNRLPEGESAKSTEGRDMRQSASKAHLTAAVPKGASGPEGLSRAELKEYSEALGIDEREVKALYNRVKN